MIGKRLGDSHHLGHVFHCKKYDGGKQFGSGVTFCKMYLAGIQDHCPLPDGRELMTHLKALEKCIPGQNILKKFSERRNIPLAVSQLVHDLAFGVLRLDLERPVERFIGRHHAKIFIKN